MINYTKNINTTNNKEIIHSGFAFFQVGIAASLVWSTDNLVINHFLSSDFIAPYSIAFKMFSYIFIFSAMINGVVGPIYGNLYSRNAFSEINRYISNILKILPVIGGFVWFSLIFFAKDVIYLWTGNEEAFGGYLLIFSLGLYGYLLSFVNTYATLIFSLNLANKTLFIAWGEAILNLILSIIFIRYLGIGGVALATAFAVFFSGFIFLPIYIRKFTDEKISFDFSFVKKHFLVLVFPFVALSLVTVDMDTIILKLLLYLFVSLVYFYFTWQFIHKEDRKFIINILRRRSI